MKKASVFFSQTAANWWAWMFPYGTHPRGKTEAFFVEINTFQKPERENIFAEIFQILLSVPFQMDSNTL